MSPGGRLDYDDYRNDDDFDVDDEDDDDSNGQCHESRSPLLQLNDEIGWDVMATTKQSRR